MSTSVLGKASVLTVTISSTTTVIPNIVSISGIPATGTKVDVTALSDTTVQNKTGIPDLGDFKFKLNHDPTNTVHIYMRDSQKAAALSEILVLTYPNATTNKETMGGYFVDYNVGSVDRNGTYQADVTYHVNSNTAS